MKGVLFLVAICVFQSVMAQNLVSNPSFEKYEECPKNLGTLQKNVVQWTAPTAGSSDYFHSCSKVMGTPKNFNGSQEAVDGDAYAGIYCYAPGDYREYLQGVLRQPLVEGKQYVLVFYVSLAEGSDFAVRDFGAALCSQPLALTTKKNLSRKQLFRAKNNRFQTLELGTSSINEDTTKWLKLSAVITAKGYEKHIILGNFRDNSTTITTQTKRRETQKGAYYYIDQVSLTAADEPGNPEVSLQLDTVYVFESIHFDFDAFQLTEAARTELMDITREMHANPSLHLEIHGHTDSMGSTNYNQILSERRAKTIADYFVGQGLPPQRIQWYGHAGARPKATNSSAIGRAKNRRVEFVFRTKER